MQIFIYRPTGTCSSKFTFEIEADTIQSLKVEGGCSGNLLGISNLVKGKKIEEILPAFEGVLCGMRKTSCPDQIAKALMQYRSENSL